MASSILRGARRPAVHAWIGVILLIIVILFFYLSPALASRDRLDVLRKQERPKHCIGRTDNGVPGSVPGREKTEQQSQAIGSAEAARDENQQNEATACLSGEQVAVASRANFIAIEAATSAIAGVFVAYLAAIISIIALLAVLFGSRKSLEAFLVVEFVPNTPGASDGTISIHNRGSTSVLLDRVVVNGNEAVRSASSDGLVEITAAGVSAHSVVLVDRGGSRCFIDFMTLQGSRHEIEVHLKRNTGGWLMASMKKHR